MHTTTFCSLAWFVHVFRQKLSSRWPRRVLALSLGGAANHTEHMTLSSKVNLQHAINFRALFGAIWSRNTLQNRGGKTRVAHRPRGGVRPFHQKSTCITQLTSERYVVQIWPRNTPNSGPSEPFELHCVGGLVLFGVLFQVASLVPVLGRIARGRTDWVRIPKNVTSRVHFVGALVPIRTFRQKLPDPFAPSLSGQA